MSGIVLDISLADLEYIFDNYTCKSICLQLGIKGKRSAYIAAVRYADDTFLISRRFCTTCLTELISALDVLWSSRGKRVYRVRWAYISVRLDSS